MALPTVHIFPTAIDPITSLTIVPPGALFHPTRANVGPSLPNAVLNFYLTTTSTPQNVYQDGAMTNPFSPTGQVTADGYGRFPAIYLDNTVAYKVTLSNNSAAVVRTRDPYNPAMAITGQAQVAASQGLVINAQGEMTLTEASSGGTGNELTITAGLSGALKIQGISPGVATLIADVTATTGAQTATFAATNMPPNQSGLQISGTATVAPAGAGYVGGTLTVAFNGTTASTYSIILSTGQVILNATFTNGSTTFTTPSTTISGTPSATFAITLNTGPSGWLPIQCDGVTYYTPLFRYEAFTPYKFLGATYNGQVLTGASVTFNGNGTETLTGSGASATPPTWYSPPTVGIGASVYFQPTVTNNNGYGGLTFTGGPVGSWTNIGSGSLTIAANSNQTLVGTYQIGTSGGGTIYASGTITIQGCVTGVQSPLGSSLGTFGFLDFDPSGTTTVQGASNPGNWFAPTTGGIGSSYWINVAQTGGSGTLGSNITQGSWVTLNQAVTSNLWPISASVTGSYQISNTSSSAGLLGSGTFTLGSGSPQVVPQNFSVGTSGTIVFNTNGTMGGSVSGNWYSTTTAGIGSSYWLEITNVNGGTLTGISANTWTALSSAITLGNSGSSNLTANWQIAINSGGTIIAAGGTISISGGFTPVTRIYTSGSGATETAPTGCSNVVIEDFGSSGSGGNGQTGTKPFTGGSGGASGGYCRSSYAITGGQTLHYTIATSGPSATTVSSGTKTITTMTANGGGNGSANGPPAGSGGTASGGNVVAGTTGHNGVAGGTGGPGAGGTGIVGVYDTGNNGGAGSYSTGNPGGTGIVVFHYT